MLSAIMKLLKCLYPKSRGKPLLKASLSKEDIKASYLEGQYHQLIKNVDPASETDPELLLLAADSFSSLGDKARSLDTFRLALDLCPDHIKLKDKIRLHFVCALFKAENYSEALVLMYEVSPEMRSAELYKYMMVRINLALERPEQTLDAIRVYNQRFEGLGALKDKEMLYYSGRCREMLRQCAAARQCYQSLFEREPTYKDVEKRLAEVTSNRSQSNSL